MLPLVKSFTPALELMSPVRTIIGIKNKLLVLNLNLNYTLFFFFYKNIVFPAQAEYSYFSADVRLKIFL